MVYYDPDDYSWSITTPFYEEEEEEEPPPKKQKNKKNIVVTSEGPTLERKKFTRKKSAIKYIKKREEGQTFIIEAIERYSDQFEDKDDDD